ncbi:MAG: hypothetical protein LBT89_03125, partial [Planctomycetaceae bacterium]|nr:hypothetical protein [Planctomycetaceae bacterium]
MNKTLACCLGGILPLALLAPALFAADTVKVHLQSRIAGEAKDAFEVKTEVQEWNPKETAIVICDMWNQHWCKGATARVAEMAPQMNKVLTAARDKGVTIFHAPSGCMKFYENHPARKRALEIEVDPVVREVLGGENWSSGLTTEKNVKWPVDQSDGGCDCEPKCPGGGPWKSQIDILTIDGEKDFITDSG